MYAKVIHSLIDLIPGVHPDLVAMLHEQVAEETVALLNAAPGDGGAQADEAAAPPPPAPPGPAAGAIA